MASNKTMGIVGYGDIGASCAKIAKDGFNMKVIGVKRNPKAVNEQQRQHIDEIMGEDRLDYLLSSSDFVVGVLPQTENTKDMFNYKRF